MSHVPDEGFDGFLRLVAACTAPGGAVFLLDSLRDERSTAVDHVLPEDRTQTDGQRRLDDGREFTIVKRFRSAASLAAACARAGLDVEVRSTETYFQVVTGTRAT